MTTAHSTGSQAGSTALAVGALLLAMATVQSGAAIAKTLFAAAGPEGVTALRTGFAAIMLCALQRPWRGPGLSSGRFGILVAYGASLGVMNLLFYWSLLRLPLGVAVTIELVGPLTLSLLHSRRRADLFWLGLAAAGLACLAPLGRISSGIDHKGALFALGAGACWALYIEFGHRAARVVPPGRASAIGMAVAAAVTLPFGFLKAGAALSVPSILISGLLVALLSSAIPYSLEIKALRRLPPRTFGVLMSLEPAMAALAGVLFLGERLAAGHAIAIVLVIVASAGATLTTARR